VEFSSEISIEAFHVPWMFLEFVKTVTKNNVHYDKTGLLLNHLLGEITQPRGIGGVFSRLRYPKGIFLKAAGTLYLAASFLRRSLVNL
jgi:hypothetical protein